MEHGRCRADWEMGLPAENQHLEMRTSSLESAINAILQHLEQIPGSSTSECRERRIPIDSAMSDLVGLLAAGEMDQQLGDHENLARHSCVETNRLHVLVRK